MTARRAPVVVVMGVAGCGKTTIGRLLAQELVIPYAEADDFHPEANIERMARGQALDDEDRAPWLARVAERIAAAGDDGLVVSCSALKRRYRDRLRAADPHLWVVHLALDEPTAAARVAARPGHFMPASLVASQFEALESLAPDEPGTVVVATQSPADIVKATVGALP